MAPSVLGRRSLDGYRSAAWDAADDRDASAILRGIGTVVHAAAHVPSDMTDPGEAETCMAINALGTLRLLRAAGAAGVGRFVHVSTGGLFARQDAPVEDDDCPRAYPHGASCYLSSKLAAEALVVAAGGIETLIVRPSSIYGSGSRGGFINLVLDRLSRHEALTLHDGGRHAADFVHVEDVADLVARAALSRHRGFLNAGSGVAHDLRSVVEIARQLLPGSRSKVAIEDPAPGQAPGGFAALSTDRARALFGYRPRPLAEGLAQVLAERGEC